MGRPAGRAEFMDSHGRMACDARLYRQRGCNSEAPNFGRLGMLPNRQNSAVRSDMLDALYGPGRHLLNHHERHLFPCEVAHSQHWSVDFDTVACWLLFPRMET